MSESISTKIESILFYKAAPVSFSVLAELLSVSKEEAISGVNSLSESLHNRGLSLVLSDNDVALVTSPENSAIIESIQKEELSKELSRAALETLSIVLYKHPISRADVDYIRGVGSQYTLRALMVRGLIDRSTKAAVTYYSPTIEALRFLGVESPRDLPEYEAVAKKVERVLDASKDDDESDVPESQNDLEEESD